jgi:electron transport complex protein RnfG
MGKHFKTAMILTVLMVVIAVILASVYMVTKQPIAKSDLEAKLAAIKSVLMDPDTGNLLINENEIPKTLSQLEAKVWKSNPSGTLYADEKVKGYVLSPAYMFKAKNGKPIYVLIGYGIGFGGRVVTVAAFEKKKDGFYENAIRVIDYSNETPGLGANINKPQVRERFYSIPESGFENEIKVNKDASLYPLPPDYKEKLNYYKSKGVVVTSDVMTGATITPRAVVSTLNAMYAFLKKEAK